MNTFSYVRNLLGLVEIAVSLILFKGKKLKKSTKFASLFNYGGQIPNKLTSFRERTGRCPPLSPDHCYMTYYLLFCCIKLGQYVPQLSAILGTNYFDQDYKMLKVLVRGSQPVEVRTAPVLVIAFELPAMTEDEFFGDNLVQNLATFLKVPPDMIRITQIIREDGSARRRKRSVGLKVEVEIKKPPVQQMSNSTDSMWENLS